jgi:hypothetical protein
MFPQIMVSTPEGSVNEISLLFYSLYFAEMKKVKLSPMDIPTNITDAPLVGLGQLCTLTGVHGDESG